MMTTPQKQGIQLEISLDEAFKKLNIFDVIMREGQLIKNYGKEFYGIDHYLMVGNYIITIQDKWEITNPSIAQVDQFISVTEQLVKLTGKELLCALFVSKIQMTPNGLQKLTNINNDNLCDKYLSIHADTFDTLITSVMSSIKSNLKLKGVIKEPQQIITLREDQINDVSSFKTKLLDPPGIKTGIMVKPTGSGKTIIGLACVGEFFKKYKHKSVLWITERKDVLRSQFDDDKKLHTCINSNLLPPLDEFNFLAWYNEKANITELNKHLEGDKPIFLVTNSASLLCANKYKKISIDKFGLIIADESHWFGAPERYNFAMHAINKWTSLKAILGFSATPLRQNPESIERIKKVFGNGTHVYFISVMTFMDAIEKNIIVPPEYHWVEINQGTPISITTKINLKDHSQMLQHIERLCKMSVTKKAIFWDKNINNIKKWKQVIELAKHDKMTYPNLSQYKIFLTYSNMIKDELGQFINYNDSCLLLAVEKGKEGFDDPRIDTCGNLDYVENRSVTKSQQQDGRALRLYPGKQKGIIIDCFCFDKEEEKIKKLVSRISSYMLLLKHVESLDPTFDPDKEYESISKLLTVNEEDKTIEIKISNKKGIIFNIESTELKNIEWNNISKCVKKELRDQIYSEEITCKKAMEIIKHHIVNNNASFKSKQCYYDLCEADPRLPENPNMIYKDFPGWARYLHIDTTSYYATFEEMKSKVNIIKNSYKGDTFDLDLTYKYCQTQDPKLPPMPCDFYNTKNVTNMRDIFKTNSMSFLRPMKKCN